MRKKKRKPTRYKSITFKLTSHQKKSLDNFCKARKSTPIKAIKKSIRPLIDNYATISPVEESFVTPNQLELFTLE
ncbi:MAG: hypothetical protein NTX61_04185 [Bacteroidetes bacterium]|nr:hypothetical protein [Bacteroidota bacterium]